ncbi:MAG: hypothetical protein LBJ48_01495 [Coriobacteriales bacterium]|jgi:hypothetical protein|nr:hypothetical protein [Coriobacteriales bacterium]
MRTLEREITREQAQLLFNIDSTMTAPRYRLILKPEIIAEPFKSEQEAMDWIEATTAEWWDEA